ncbi:helix-turn-helix domain-containing protein [Rhizobium sp. TH2]|uniref:helix-turn-helix domain-containing protein n=1 Tax=Rhizobium sp. TH2 TaxID=2775403 RepID=UPI0021588F54|nr:helix-turn-helix domain-containing protein [Rhizobium sp. TH2]UVC10208.1 helix-turn-helix domain-containing protein [Rhizobium sp. TH2]
MGRFADELIESMTQALDHARGNKVDGMRLTEVHVPDVRIIRESLHMSQSEFASSFRIPLATIKNWEQGRRRPDAPALAYLRVIERSPKTVIEAVATK